MQQFLQLAPCQHGADRMPNRSQECTRRQQRLRQSAPGQAPDAIAEKSQRDRDRAVAQNIAASVDHKQTTKIEPASQQGSRHHGRALHSESRRKQTENRGHAWVTQ